MAHYDERIDDYLNNKTADFAKPILNHLRALVHQACPEVEETWKWSFPNFDYKGSPLCSMAGFKQHCAFTFWKASLLSDPHGLLTKTGESAMGHLGRITSLADLPSDEIMLQYLHEAMILNEQGIKVKKAPPKEKKDAEMPAYFSEALTANPQALGHFENFSAGSKREYVEWLAEAKTDATREKRLATAMEWISEGKKRHWKYQK